MNQQRCGNCGAFCGVRYEWRGAIFAEVIDCSNCGDAAHWPTPDYDQDDDVDDDQDDQDGPQGEVVECQVCGADVGKGPGGLGLTAHSKKHRRQFRERFGRRPEDYQEVRERLAPAMDILDDDGQMTLWEPLTDDEQLAMRDVVEVGQ